MYIQDRPPVTNLYSSAVFVGWGAVLLGAFLERFNRNGIGAAMAALVGFATLIIAHHLAMTGDTLEMMRAVLDSNFWLATHVVIITLGYSAMFFAGALAIAFTFLGLLRRGFDKSAARSLAGMVYGITCFAALFSLVGTILGGIWADQSWGRFWGWDPKENGALMIVIMCAITLHARWGGIVQERGIMALAILGNIVTAWSWFGTNLLGVGLHSYGFTDSGFLWMCAFALSQLLCIALALLPLRFWRSQFGQARR
jgi:ABC-type transport system involved in cytochrome c biogenesis permease subunit